MLKETMLSQMTKTFFNTEVIFHAGKMLSFPEVVIGESHFVALFLAHSGRGWVLPPIRLQSEPASQSEARRTLKKESI